VLLGDDEGERGLCGAGVGRVHGLYRGGGGGAGVRRNRANTLLVRRATLTGDGGRADPWQTGQAGCAARDHRAAGDHARMRRLRWATGPMTCRCCSRGRAWRCMPSPVAAQCDLRINHGDLTALLYLQGYVAAGRQAHAFGHAADQGLAFGVGGGEFLKRGALQGRHSRAGRGGRRSGRSGGRGRRRRGRRCWQRLRRRTAGQGRRRRRAAPRHARSKRSIRGPEMRPR
jgi:hypothetical protein